MKRVVGVFLLLSTVFFFAFNNCGKAGDSPPLALNKVSVYSSLTKDFFQESFDSAHNRYMHIENHIHPDGSYNSVAAIFLASSPTSAVFRSSTGQVTQTPQGWLFVPSSETCPTPHSPEQITIDTGGFITVVTGGNAYVYKDFGFFIPQFDFAHATLTEDTACNLF